MGGDDGMRRPVTPPPLCKPGYGSCNNVTQEEAYMLSLVGMARISKQRKKRAGR